MARKVRFPLKMADGASVRDPDELKMHFDLLSVLEYYANGRLAEWLDNCLYTHEAQAVRALDPSADDFYRKLCDILGVAYAEQDGSASLEKVSDKNERLAKLRQYTDDESILAAADHVVFSQDELVKLLEKEPNINLIYLCGERFAVPEDWEGITYIGVNHPQVYIGEELEGVTVEQAEVSSDRWAFKVEQLWLGLAEQGNAIAQSELGNFFGATRSVEESFQWYMKAAEQSYDKAQYNLARCYRDGAGVGKDQGEAFHWFLKASEQGHCLAQYNLARCYKDGDGVDKDEEEAFKWFLKAAEQGIADAQNQVGLYYYQRRGIKENQEKAAAWFVKAARQGHVWAQYSLAKCYRDGHGVGADQKEAFRWFLKAAEQGHKYAQREVSICYRNGRGVEQNQDEASTWSMRALGQDAVSLTTTLLRKASRQLKMDGKKYPQGISNPIEELIAPAEADFLALVPQARALGYPEYGRIHGLGHIYRVLLLSLIYYYNADDSLSPGDKSILIYFSLLHDIGRTNDLKDDSHGEKSWAKIRNKSIEIKGLDLTEEDKAIASLAIRYHCIHDARGEEQIQREMTEENSRARALKLYRICKDMDGLDRVRLKRGLDINQLRTDYAKRMADAAYIIYRDHLARELAQQAKG